MKKDKKRLTPKSFVEDVLACDRYPNVQPWPEIYFKSKTLPFSKQEVLEYILKHDLLTDFVDPAGIEKDVFDCNYLIERKSGASAVFELYYRERGVSQRTGSFSDLAEAVMAKLELSLAGGGVAFRGDPAPGA